MNILFFTTAHNSLSQRAFVELVDRGHTVVVVIASSEEVMIEAVEREHPDLIVAPLLKKVIPASIWQHHTCLIVHPGIKGDRGPSSLDWAILKGREEWGVIILQVGADLDAGAIWASRTFTMREGSKSDLYRHEVTEAAIQGLLETIAKVESHTFVPEPLDYSRADVKGRWQSPMKHADRAIDWRESSASVLRKIRCADSSPGVFDTVLGLPCYLYSAHAEDVLSGTPGEILATRDGAICRATGDGAVWITHLKQKYPDGEPSFKLPATHVLGERLAHVPEVPVALEQAYDGRTYREIWYEERQAVGYLHFAFYNGAMSTEQCQRLREAFVHISRRPTKVLVLMGGTDFWSNGIHLNVIEADADPAHESWRNICAMNDLVRDIITTDSHLVISSLQGNAAAGGVMLALLLLRKHATVMICHSRTSHLAALTRQADVLVAGAGESGMITAEMVKPGAVVIDVGMNVLPDGGMVGDVDLASVRAVAGAITPVPGGVGPLTNAMLLKQCVQAAWQLADEKKEVKTAA